MAIQITINGKSQAAAEGQTVLGLIGDLGLEPEKVAVELDRRILKKPYWAETILNDGARIEIVQFVGGG